MNEQRPDYRSLPRCEKCGNRSEAVMRGPADPRMLCHWCWADTRPTTDRPRDRFP